MKHQRRCKVWHADQLKVRKKHREAESHRLKTAREKLLLSKVTPVSMIPITHYPLVITSSTAGARPTYTKWK